MVLSGCCEGLAPSPPESKKPQPMAGAQFSTVQRFLSRFLVLGRTAAALAAILAGLAVALHPVFARATVRHLAVLHARLGIFAAAAGLCVLPGTAGSHLFSIMLTHACGVRIFRIRRRHLVTACAFGFLWSSVLLRG